MNKKIQTFLRYLYSASVRSFNNSLPSKICGVQYLQSLVHKHAIPVDLIRPQMQEKGLEGYPQLYLNYAGTTAASTSTIHHFPLSPITACHTINLSTYMGRHSNILGTCLD